MFSVFGMGSQDLELGFEVWRLGSQDFGPIGRRLHGFCTFKQRLPGKLRDLVRAHYLAPSSTGFAHLSKGSQEKPVLALEREARFSVRALSQERS